MSSEEESEEMRIWRNKQASSRRQSDALAGGKHPRVDFRQGEQSAATRETQHGSVEGDQAVTNSTSTVFFVLAHVSLRGLP